MTTIYVQGFRLPPLLCQLLDDGKWGDRTTTLPAPERYHRVPLLLPGEATPRPVSLIDVAGMAEHRQYYLGRAQSDWLLPDSLLVDYAMTSSKVMGRFDWDTRVLDVDYGLLIAEVYDEDHLQTYNTKNAPWIAYFLDYRTGLSGPRVMQFKRNQWRVFTHNFDAFARLLGLVE